jgi:type II secretory pathway pseudopilin PulG
MMLSRSELYTEARSRLPLWETMPIVSQIVGLFRRLFSGRQRKAEPDRQPAAKVLLPASPQAPAQARPAEAAPAAAKNAASSSPVAREREALLRYTRAIKVLHDTYVTKGKNIDITLDELSNKWNPLFAEAQKADLVEDVNALVRDFLRPVRRTFLLAPPDLERIKSLAAQLVDAKSLAKIKKKEPLQRYIELYMVKCLEPKKKTR